MTIQGLEMSKNNNYSGTSQTLEIKDRSLNTIVFHPTKPVLDSELNGLQDIQDAKLQDLIRSKVPSGLLDAEYSRGFDENADTFGINTTFESNTFYVNSKKEGPTLAVVNGWLINLGGSYCDEDNKLKIELSDAPSIQYREDLVFLEVWKQYYNSEEPSEEEKPDGETIYKFGNRNYGGTNLNSSDQIINPSVNFETSVRVQLQYRIRVVDSVNFINNPEGIDDINSVYAQGGSTTLQRFTFAHGLQGFDDAGLYVAGDGDVNNGLNTVDGFVYAIPLFRVHRRNKVSFAVNNQNGALYSVNDGVDSDRPDGLFYDQIAEYDIEDLRHTVSFGELNYNELLEKNLDMIYSGNSHGFLTEAQNDQSLSRTDISLFVNKLSASSQPGAESVGISPNGQQRYYSDIPKSVKTVSVVATDSPDRVTGSGSWDINDTVEINVTSPSPNGTVIGAFTPKVMFSISGEVDTFSEVNGTWVGNEGIGVSGATGTATFTILSTSGLVGQNLNITFEVDYPQIAHRLTKPVTDIIKIEEVSDSNKTWGFRSIHDVDTLEGPMAAQNLNRREQYIPNAQTVGEKTSYAYTYDIVPKNELDPYMGTIVSVFMEGQPSSPNYTISGSLLNLRDTAYCLAAYDETGGSYMDISASRNPITGELVVTLPGSKPTSSTIRFDVGVLGGVLEYDDVSQSITDMARIKMFDIYGNGTDKIVLEGLTSIVLGTQSEYKASESTPSLPVFDASCYLQDDGFSVGRRTDCTVNIEPDSNLVSLFFASGVVPSTTKISIALLVLDALDSNDDLNIFYNYKEYKGVTQKVNYNAASRIDSIIKKHKTNLQIVSNGTGEITNPAKTLPKQYEPLISKLPLESLVSEGVFKGSLYTNERIIGGSYELDTLHKAPYTTGRPNYMEGLGAKGRGTPVGGMATTSLPDGYEDVARLLVSPMVEMVTGDSTKNFVPGEIALKIETRYISDDAGDENQITNFNGLTPSGETHNSFDMFKLEGRPLIKLKSK